MNLRKLAALLMAAVLLIAFSACGVQGWQDGASGTGSEAESSSEAAAGDYEDSLQGLCDYFTEKGYVSGEKTDMEAQIIGAEAGVKYTFPVSKITVNLEIYEFDPENLNEIGKETIESVKTNGYFTVLGTQVNAVLSDNGKYLLIYAEAKESDEITAQKEAVIADFKVYKG